jgi:hypothetical protein
LERSTLFNDLKPLQVQALTILEQYPTGDMLANFSRISARPALMHFSPDDLQVND